MAFSAVRWAPKPQLDHSSCMPASKVGKHYSPHFKKKNQDKTSPGQCARLRNPVALLEFRLVAKPGFDVRSTNVLSMRSTQLTHGLHFATATPAPRVFAVRSLASVPCQDSVGQTQFDLRSLHLALPARTLWKEAVGLCCSYALFVQGTIPSSSFAPWAKPSASTSCQVASCSKHLFRDPETSGSLRILIYMS